MGLNDGDSKFGLGQLCVFLSGRIFWYALKFFLSDHLFHAFLIRCLLVRRFVLIRIDSLLLVFFVLICSRRVLGL